MGMIVNSVLDLQINAFFRLNDFLGRGRDVYLKLEGLNAAGSIKFKPAKQMLRDLEGRGVIKPGRNKILESSSGNLGVALALACKIKGYPFTCITDPNISPFHHAQIQHYGGKVIVVTKRDANGGFLQTRLDLIQHMRHEDPALVWTNQYANPANPQAHYLSTAPEIHAEFPHLDYLFIGAGTTGTLVGCARFFQEHAPSTAIVAVDSVGSVTFGGMPYKRHIPGLGTSRPPEISNEVAKLSNIRKLVMIPEATTVRMCYEVLDRYSLWVGGSTGTVLAGIRCYQPYLPASATIVAISPDMGERYAATVYNPEWMMEKFERQFERQHCLAGEQPDPVYLTSVRQPRPAEPEASRASRAAQCLKST